MKKPFIFLLSSFLVLGSALVGCDNEPPKTEENNQDTEGNTDPDNGEGNTDPDNGGNTDPDVDNGETEGGDTEDNTNTYPNINDYELKTLAEAREICETVEKEPGADFSKQYVRTKGKVLSDFAISSGNHFIILADETGTFPIMVDSSNTTTSYFYIHETYEVVGLAGSFKEHSCLNVNKKANVTVVPIESTDEKYEKVDLSTISTPKTLDEIYTEAYTIKVQDNKTDYSENLYKFSATFVKDITDGLVLIFDGNTHMIVHGDKYKLHALQDNTKYEFYGFPSVDKGKRSAECVGFKSLNEKDTAVMDKMKEKAVLKTVNDLYNTDRYNDNKKLYPHIFKVEGYISAHITDNYYYLALVDDLNVNPSYGKNTNERPKAIYAKNHQIDVRDYARSKSKLKEYFESKAKETFYFVATEYASDLHVYRGFFFDEMLPTK